MSRPTSLSVVLHLGSRGPDVERVQGALKARGFFEGESNGLFGIDTEAAVQGFQRSVGLRVDGTVSPEVRSALLRDEALEKAAQAAIHAHVHTTVTSGGVGVGALQAPAMPVVPPPVQHIDETASPVSTGLLIVGGILGLGILLMATSEPKPAFSDYEDDSGLPPLVPGLDDDDDDGSDDDEIEAAPDLADDGQDPLPDPTPADGAYAEAPTDIVPYGGGAPLKRGAGGKFLPRAGG